MRDVIEKSPGLKSQWKADEGAESELAANWALVKDWKEEARYEPGGKTQQQAEELLSAISDSQHGVVQWLRRYW